MFDVGQLTGQAVPERIKKAKVNSKNHAQHQVAYRERRKAGLTPVERPWEWLSRFELIELVWSAYKVATWDLRDDVQEPMDHQTPRELRETFVDQLAERFKDALYAYAAKNGRCFELKDETPPYERYEEIWKRFQDQVDPGWGPQYPLYSKAPKKVSPASAANAPGDVTTADEGNRNGDDFSHSPSR